MKVLGSIVITILLMVSAAGAQMWQWQNPRPTVADIWDIQFISSVEGWAVGATGTILHTTDGGVQWTIRRENAGSNELRKVSFVDALHGWVGGNGFLRTTDGGVTWTTITVHGMVPSIHFLHFVDLNHGWFIGGYASGAAGDTLWATTDGGQSWSVQYTGQPVGNTMPFNFTFVDSLNGWLNAWGHILHTTNGGGTWSPQRATSGYFGDLSFVNPLVGYVTDSNHFLRTTDSGATWDTVAVPAAYFQLGHSEFDTPDHGWLIGDGSTGSYLLETDDGGQTWTSHGRVPIGFTNAWVHVHDCDHIWTGESAGMIWFSGDHGDTWNLQTPGTRADLQAVACVGSQKAWAAASGQSILITTDAGLHWTEQNIGVYIGPASMQFVSETHGWIFSVRSVQRTTDGGVTWSSRDLDYTANAEPEFSFADSLVGWVAGLQDSIQHTTDGGDTWEKLPVCADSLHCYLNSVAAVSATEAWMAGEQDPSDSVRRAVLYHTTDGGGTWNEVPTPTTSNRFSRVFFSDPRHGWALNDNTGVTVRTTDGGATWTLMPNPLPGYAWKIAFADSMHGWAALSSQSVRTTDGGLSWETVPEINPNVRAFAFSGPNNGYVVGYNGVIQHFSAASWSAPHSAPTAVPQRLALTAYPNPFNPSTVIRFSLPKTERAKLTVYDVTGREVKVLEDGVLSAGDHGVTLEGSALASGVYFARLEAGKQTQMRKLMLLK